MELLLEKLTLKSQIFNERNINLRFHFSDEILRRRSNALLSLYHSNVTVSSENKKWKRSTPFIYL